MKKFRLLINLDGMQREEEWTFDEINATETTESEYLLMTSNQQIEWRDECARERVMELLSYSMEEIEG